MLATLVDGPPDQDLRNERLVYEPKYDGIRALVSIEPGHPSPTVRLWSRLGNEKSAQFPELIKDLKLFGRSLKASVLLDGEIVALDPHGEPTSFGHIQSRLHVTNLRGILEGAHAQPVAFYAFDVLRDGPYDVRGLPLSDRRSRLERIMGQESTSLVRQSRSDAGDGRVLYEEARKRGWEGLVAKESDSRYTSGRRTPAWRKLKITRRQEFVVCGWTEPRQTRAYFGALLLGVYDPPFDGEGGVPPKQRLVFVGQVGSGFDHKELTRVWTLLTALETDVCPFEGGLSTKDRAHWTKAEPAHWVKPQLVAEVRFTEWTTDQRLRHPVYLGLRDDKDPRTIGRESGEPTTQRRAAARVPEISAAARGGARPASPRPRHVSVSDRATRPKTTASERAHLAALVDQLSALEEARRDGRIEVARGEHLEVSNLAKVFWPTPKLTKGDLLRYYVRVSPWLLPAVADRPLVMKRFHDGVKGKSFYQHRPADPLPRGVDVALVNEHTDEREPEKPMFVGGRLFTLLYMTQLATISQDPWFSRVKSQATPDAIALDLDPMPGVPFDRVVDVARWIGDSLETMRVPGVLKTSGSSGLHVYVPMPRGTTYEIGQMFGRIVATLVASQHPGVATVERAVNSRGRTVYIDFLQNIRGKTLATAYSARASEFAGVSTPLTWSELDQGIRPEDFTLQNAVERFEEVGDLWARLRAARPRDLRDALDALSRGR